MEVLIDDACRCRIENIRIRLIFTTHLPTILILDFKIRSMAAVCEGRPGQSAALGEKSLAGLTSGRTSPPTPEGMVFGSADPNDPNAQHAKASDHKSSDHKTCAFDATTSETSEPLTESRLRFHDASASPVRASAPNDGLNSSIPRKRTSDVISLDVLEARRIFLPIPPICRATLFFSHVHAAVIFLNFPRNSASRSPTCNAKGNTSKSTLSFVKVWSSGTRSSSGRLRRSTPPPPPPRLTPLP